MLRSLQDLEGYSILATDGEIGHVKDVFFDDEAWVIRYLVVETGSWLLSRKVLISPMAIGEPDWNKRLLPVSVTKEKVRNSPDIDTEQPVSRQHEKRYLGYYGYPYYWDGSGLWGMDSYPSLPMTGIVGVDSKSKGLDPESGAALARTDAVRNDYGDPHLRSAKAVMGYRINALDGEIGHVQGVLVDERTWAIRYLIVNTGDWWHGHQMLIAPGWIHEVSWLESSVSVNLTRQVLKSAPPYKAPTQLDRIEEAALHKHYGRRGYWEDEPKRVT
jgi:uncharacterized protein YrrD